MTSTYICLRAPSKNPSDVSLYFCRMPPCLSLDFFFALRAIELTPKKTSLGMGSEPTTRLLSTPIHIPGELFCWDFFEMYYKMTGSSAKLDQCNTCFAALVGILLGQTPVIGGGGRYDRAAGRDIKQTCREVAREKHIERRLL